MTQLVPKGPHLVKDACGLVQDHNKTSADMALFSNQGVNGITLKCQSWSSLENS